MLRRQALGTLNQNESTSSSSWPCSASGSIAINTASSVNVNTKPMAGATSFKGMLQPAFSSTDEVNNENKPPSSNMDMAPAISSSKQTAEHESSLFKEEFNDFKDEDEYEDVDDDEDDDDDEEEEAEEEEDDDEEKADEFHEQFQDISRLNLNENEKTDIMNNVMMLETFSTSQSTSDSSPMILDETIKHKEDVEEENVLESYDETDEQTCRKLEHEERENILMNCLEYKSDIMSYMRRLESENRPKVNYMKRQSDITTSMRSILVDWLVEVSEEYHLNAETLYLAVNYTDRFLSQMSVLRGKLQLVGTASMYIAAKYEEITPPDVAEFVFITDDTYSKKQVLRMEHLLLKILGFRMSTPTISWFLMHFLRFIKLGTSLNTKANLDLYNRIECLSRYLCELTLIDADTYLSYLPSQIAASALYLTFLTLNRPWTKQVADIIGYNHDLSELKSCICDLYKTMQQAPSHPQQAIQEKYKQPKFEYASIIDPPKTLPSHLFNNSLVPHLSQ